MTWETLMTSKQFSATGEMFFFFCFYIFYKLRDYDIHLIKVSRGFKSAPASRRDKHLRAIVIRRIVFQHSN